MKKYLKCSYYYLTSKGYDSSNSYFVRDLHTRTFVDGRVADASSLSKYFRKANSLSDIHAAIEQVHKGIQGKGTANVFSVLRGNDSGSQLTLVAAGDIKVYSYSRDGIDGKPSVGIVHEPTAAVGATKQCPALSEICINANDILNEFSGRDMLVCENRVAQVLGDERIQALLCEYGKGASCYLYKGLLKAAQEAGLADCGVVTIVSTYIIVDRSDEPERCWNTDCEKWATCNGYGCPAGNWHDS